MYKLFLIITITILISGCGGGGSSSSSQKNSVVQTNSITKVGYLIDSAVSGVEYSCGKIGGITGKDGEFLYTSSCNIVFTVGNVILGEINASAINSDQKVIPADLVGVSRDNITNEKVICLIQFLQSLDKDNNPDNNIEISQTIRSTLSNSTLDFSSNQLNDENIEQIVFSMNKNLVSKEDALRHYTKVLKNNLLIDINQNDGSKEELTSISLIEPEVEVMDEIEKVIQKIEEEISTLFLDEEHNASTSNQNSEPTVDMQENQTIDDTQIVLPTIISNIETQNTMTKENIGFSYANQRDVSIEVSAIPRLFNKQILFFESLRMITTPVGEVENLENKILSTVFNEEGKLNIEYTFANHITSIWMVVPYYGIQMEIPIINDRIYITLKEGDSL